MQDFNLHSAEPILDREEELIWQQVNILFDTMPGLLHGDLDYGTDYEHYLFELNQSPEDLQYRMERDLSGLNLFGYDPTVKVSLYKGTQHDIALIEVDLRRGNRVTSKIYKIE